MNEQPENSPQVETEKTIQVKTTHAKKKFIPEKSSLEFKKGRIRTKSEKSDPKRITRTRIMITFDNEASYRFLLNDQEELQKLKPNSYLDLDFLEKEKKYRVHLYYRTDLRTRIVHWESKYPQIRKSIDPDEQNIRTRIDTDNSLSSAIEEVLKLSCVPIGPKHEKPPTPSEESEGKKKLKIIQTVTDPNQKKTRPQLLAEVNNLTVALKLTSDDLQARTQENFMLHRDLEQTKEKVQSLLNQQDFFKGVFHVFIGKLSPASKADLKDILSKHGLDVENQPFKELEEDIESPKSRVFSHDDIGETEENYNFRDQTIVQMEEEFVDKKLHEIEAKKSRQTKGSDILSPKPIISSYDQVEVNKIVQGKYSQSNKSESSFIISEDDLAVPILRSPSQTLKLEKGIDERKLARIKISSKKKSAKRIWSHLSQDNQKIMEKIKQAKPPHTSLESFLQNLKHISPNWKPVIRDHFVELKAYLDQ